MIFVFLGLVAGFGGLLAIVSHFLNLFDLSTLATRLLSPSVERALTATKVSQEKESRKTYFFLLCRVNHEINVYTQ